MNDTAALITSIVASFVSLVGVVGLVIDKILTNKTAARTEKRLEKKDDVDKAAVLVDSSQDVVQLYKDLSTELRGEIKEIRQKMETQEETIAQLNTIIKRLNDCLKRAMARIEYLMRGINMLICQIIALNHKPVWQPEEWTLEDKESSK